MEKVCYSVLFIFLINHVFAFNNVCNNLILIDTCDECIRCSGYWCNDPNEGIRCVNSLRDNWCNYNQEPIPSLPDSLEKGEYFNFKNRVKSIYRDSDSFDITYSYKNETPKVNVLVDSTQNPNVNFENTTSCSNGVCTTTLEPDLGTDFCDLDGKPYEFFNLRLTVEGISEEVNLRYHVPCACNCSDVVEQKSRKCSEHGNYSCGTCACDEGWTGKSCEQCDAAYDTRMSHKCKRGRYSCGKCVCDANWSGELCDKCDARGDVGEECGPRDIDTPECSGHGTCDCGCVCYSDPSLYGSRYFDRNNNCQDLCMHISSICDQCTFDSKPGKCDGCEFPLYRQPYNASVMEERDQLNRHMWVQCNVTNINNCTIEYAAMRSDAGDTYMMIINSCDPTTEARAGQVNMTVPIVLGLLAAVALLAAAGYVLYRSRLPPLPLNDPAYTNVGAEDCVGENPLYKPPTSSFKNPTYGKW